MSRFELHRLLAVLVTAWAAAAHAELPAEPFFFASMADLRVACAGYDDAPRDFLDAACMGDVRRLRREVERLDPERRRCPGGIAPLQVSDRELVDEHDRLELLRWRPVAGASLDTPLTAWLPALRETGFACAARWRPDEDRHRAEQALEVEGRAAVYVSIVAMVSPDAGTAISERYVDAIMATLRERYRTFSAAAETLARSHLRAAIDARTRNFAGRLAVTVMQDLGADKLSRIAWREMPRAETDAMVKEAMARALDRLIAGWDTQIRSMLRFELDRSGLVPR